jgi:hypothetical protein
MVTLSFREMTQRTKEKEGSGRKKGATEGAYAQWGCDTDLIHTQKEILKCSMT